MYNQFCRNLKYFISIIKSDDDKVNSRYKNAVELLPLTDIASYREYKNSRKEEYINISNLIFDISRHSEDHPKIKRFIWELWAYGFDIKQTNEPINKNYAIDEVVKLIDLMLSTHYFV